MKRTKMSLKKETVRVLSNVELKSVDGGGSALSGAYCQQMGSNNSNPSSSDAITSDVNVNVYLGSFIVR